MIIVSQDKYNILNFDTTTNIGVEEISTLNDKVQITANTLGQSVVLGKYKNEKRAKEVVKYIYTAYKCIKLLENPHLQVAQGIIEVKELEDCLVYEMPEE